MSKYNKKIKILMAAAEIAPFAKVGGLADVLGSLPPALAKLGVDVRVIMPLYGSISRKKYGLKKKISRIAVCAGQRRHLVNVWEGRLPHSRVPVYFIEEPGYFGAKGVYTGKNNAERFLFFSLACLHAMPHLKFRPDIIHCHDFHTALVPDLLKAQNFRYYARTKTVFTIHNLNYQGKAEAEVLSTGDLSAHSLASLARDARDGDINFMVQGILGADAVTTVSETYAREITTRPYGADLDNILRQRRDGLTGIVNGIDTDFFDPTKDKSIKNNYSVSSLAAKTANKLYLQKKLGFPANPGIPLAGMVSRLVGQKGVDLVDERFARLDCQFVFLGTGQKKYEDRLKNLAKKYPKKFSAQIGFDAKLAQEIYAGADIFLMPSRFEPCGLGQMIAVRYGTVPVARETGGLADTIVNSKLVTCDSKLTIPRRATGFLFKNSTPAAFYQTLKQALDIYNRYPQIWKKLQINGMRQDVSWNKSAKKYLRLFQKLAK